MRRTLVICLTAALGMPFYAAGPLHAAGVQTEEQVLLLQALRAGNVEDIAVLLKGRDVNNLAINGVPPLVIASLTGQTKVVQALLGMGAEVDRPGPAGLTALLVAVLMKHGDVIKVLIDAGANVDLAESQTGYTALIMASAGDIRNTMPALATLAAGFLPPNPPVSSVDPVDLVQMLIAAGADVNKLSKDGSTALRAAAGQGLSGTVRVLLDAGANVNAKDTVGGTALMAAALFGRTETASILLSAGADVNATFTRGVSPMGGSTALMASAMSGRADTVQLLIDAGADLDAKADGGSTPLMVAASRAEPRAVKALLDAGADFQASTNVGETAVKIALAGNRKEVLALLKAAGAEVPETGTNAIFYSPKYGWSVVHLEDWLINNTDPAFVRLQRIGTAALCGVHTRNNLQFSTVTEFERAMHAQVSQTLAQQGLTTVVLSQNTISLPNGITGRDVLVDLRPSGRSRRLYILKDQTGYLIDCETNLETWMEAEPLFEEIIRSFTLE